MEESERRLREYIANYPDDPAEVEAYRATYPGPIIEEECIPEPDVNLLDTLSRSKKPRPLVHVPRGMLFIITRGDYSDYEVLGFYRALRPFDREILTQHFAADFRYYGQEGFVGKAEVIEGNSYYNEEALVTWLLEQGYIEAIEGYNMHIDGGSIDNMRLNIDKEPYDYFG